MEKAHLKAVTAIETFVAQLSTADPSPRFVTNLIENATSSPNTFVFGELLDCPAVQKLRDEGVSQEHLAYLTSLEIFAWGTWEEYHCESAIFILPMLSVDVDLTPRSQYSNTKSSPIE